MLFSRRIALAAIALVIALPFSLAQAQESKVIRLATTTSTENTGLLKHLLPKFEQQSGYEVQVIATGTGKALNLARAGDVDIVMTHAPAAEAKFVSEGYGRLPRQFMENDFVVLGPKRDPANVVGAENVQQAFSRIAEAKGSFLSRGDNSGTHMKERAIWEASGFGKGFDGYLEVGQGMGKTLQMANELEGYVLADRGTYLAYKGNLKIGIVFEGGPQLANPYQVMLISESKYPHLNHAGAKALSDFFVSATTQAMINEFLVNGEQLFKATYLAQR
ncbi:substrate-binding domain-containing protein [Paraferrimonas sedimenticola]|uniref:Tungsten ABC transporter substrate-binding protein n=1 Tax=Paraferrimonas sedimenticola TaxID=375674 RepID=A0AA37W2D2_9GAMM|nr:substrate-binding domain-containing protein [Paraferrimonas sedimenticola]GLP97543.1 tungsten ABC transporter substrate-binding protein [Paraferrimonas sedimenticola]